MTGLMGWTPRPRPAREALEGRLVRLEPLEPSVHGDDLFAASMGDGTEDRFRFLFDAPCERPAFAEWLARSAMSVDPLFFAVIEKATGRTEGRQALMRIEPAHGVVEIGNILWGRPSPGAPQRRRRCIWSRLMSSTSSAIAVSNGNAMR